MSGIYIFSALVVYSLLIMLFCNFLFKIDFSFRNQQKTLYMQIKEHGLEKVVQMYTIIGVLFATIISITYFLLAAALFIILFGVS